jgi:hypothetical protein
MKITMKKQITLLISAFALLLIVGCSSPGISNDPVQAAYLGDTTTFEGNTSLDWADYNNAKKTVRNALLSNGFKLVSEDDLNKQIVASRKVDEGFVTTTIYFYSASSTVNLRVVTQVPRNGTAYYRVHEQIMTELK